MDKKELLEYYCAQHSSAEPQHLQLVTKKTWQQMANPRMVTGHLQGRLLSMLSQLCKPKIAVEIGTFTGYGALCIAEGLAQNGKLYSLEIDAEHALKAQGMIKNLPNAQKIEIVNQNGLDFIGAYEGIIDMLYVDGEKRSYEKYVDLAMQKMKSGGLLLFDNTLWGNKVIEPHMDTDTAIMHKFNTTLSKRTDIDVLILPIRDGLTVCVVK